MNEKNQACSHSGGTGSVNGQWNLCDVVLFKHTVPKKSLGRFDCPNTHRVTRPTSPRLLCCCPRAGRLRSEGTGE